MREQGHRDARRHGCPPQGPGVRALDPWPLSAGPLACAVVTDGGTVQSLESVRSAGRLTRGPQAPAPDVPARSWKQGSHPWATQSLPPVGSLAGWGPGGSGGRRPRAGRRRGRHVLPGVPTPGALPLWLRPTDSAVRGGNTSPCGGHSGRPKAARGSWPPRPLSAGTARP